MRPAIHPGEILAEELGAIAVTPTELARQLRVPANRVTQIIQGKRAITGDAASCATTPWRTRNTACR